MDKSITCVYFTVHASAILMGITSERYNFDIKRMFNNTCITIYIYKIVIIIIRVGVLHGIMALVLLQKLLCLKKLAITFDTGTL